MNFIQNLKLGHYMKLPPRSTFIAQITSTLICSLVQVGTKDLLFATVSDVCGNKPKDLLSCASTKVFFTSSVIWYVSRYLCETPLMSTQGIDWPSTTLLTRFVLSPPDLRRHRWRLFANTHLAVGPQTPKVDVAQCQPASIVQRWTQHPSSYGYQLCQFLGHRIRLPVLDEKTPLCLVVKVQLRPFGRNGRWYCRIGVVHLPRSRFPGREHQLVGQHGVHKQ